MTDAPDRRSVGYWAGWAAVAGLVVAVIAIIVQHDDALDSRGPADGTATAQATPPAVVGTTEPAQTGPTETESSTPSSAILSVKADIWPDSRRGPNRSLACDFEAGSTCISLDVYVMTAAGRLISPGCYLSWKVYKLGAKTTLFETGSQPDCEEIDVGVRRDLPAGKYRVDLKVETDDPTVTGSGSYTWTAVLDQN